MSNPTENLQPLFAPRGIAVIGASKSPGKLGAVMAEAIAGYDAPVFLINPRGGEGMHVSVEAAARDSGQPIDLAILCVPAKFTADSLRDAAKGGAKAALLCAGGFAEAQGEGYQFDAEMRQAAEETGIRILGPNTSGFFLPPTGLHASFVPGVAEIPAGGIGVVSASGGINHSLAFRLQRVGAGVSLGVGIGGGVGVTGADVVDYLAEDENTSVILLHIETIPDGDHLLEAVRRASRKKPVVSLVIGRHDIKEFAERHTGSLATSWHLIRSLLEQAGAVVTEDEQELVEIAMAFEHQRLAAEENPGVALLTGQAGTGLVMHDHLLEAEVRLADLHGETITTIEALLPPLTFQHNPVDTGRPAINFWEVMKAVAEDSRVKAIGVYSIIESLVHLPTAVEQAGAAGRLPVVIGTDSITSATTKLIAEGREKKLPVVLGPTAVARGVKALARDAHAQWSLAQPHLQAEVLDVSSGDVLDALASVGITSAPAPAKGVEMVLGAHRDPVFGPVVTLGLGGVAAAIAEPSVKGAQISQADVEMMVKQLPGRAVLAGWHGADPVDTAALAHLLATLGATLVDNKDIESITLNPVVPVGDGFHLGAAEILRTTEDSLLGAR
ncbi:acetate--CoA ligase family protein [Corynebacterium sp. A21]|uniref:acetate--CoA ligase family protein n=1 Tax=Corynebacterium sp. A21 TaxID=3457318 RepID=UPI003FD5ECC3